MIYSTVGEVVVVVLKSSSASGQICMTLHKTDFPKCKKIGKKGCIDSLGSIFRHLVHNFSTLVTRFIWSAQDKEQNYRESIDTSNKWDMCDLVRYYRPFSHFVFNHKVLSHIN